MIYDEDEEVRYATRRSGETTDTQAEVREFVGEHVAGFMLELEGIDEIEVFGSNPTVGPYGGRSQQILAALEWDGELQIVAINVYCDDAIKKHLTTILEAAEAKRKEDNKLRKLMRKTAGR